MKIQVGKTYRDNRNIKVKIVINLDKEMPGYPVGGGHTFVGQDETGAIYAYNAAGRRAWNETAGYAGNLIPNIVKKEGWVIMWKEQHNGGAAYPGSIIYASYVDAKNAGKDSTAYASAAKIEWEEEDV